MIHKYLLHLLNNQKINIYTSLITFYFTEGIDITKQNLFTNCNASQLGKYVIKVIEKLIKYKLLFFLCCIFHMFVINNK